MKQQVIYVMTHDSIGLGEDGPTHQPIEHLASLRAMPGLYVMRPADAVEVAECWMIALETEDAPSLLALSRQSVPTLRHTFVFGENLSRLGAYVLRDASKNCTERLCLIATGSEVSLALDVQKLLEETEEIGVRVVSMPCQELFDQQTPDYQQKTLGCCQNIFTIEAASTFGWERYATSRAHCIGLDSFGASAPAKDLYAHFGLTTGPIAARIKEILKGSLAS
jgi:transketolase